MAVARSMRVRGFIGRLRRQAGFRADEAGFSLVEALIALGLVAVLVVLLLRTLSTITVGEQGVSRRTEMLTLARNQLEDVDKQPFQTSYPAVTAVPVGLSVDPPEVGYVVTYTIPAATPYTAAPVLQVITVTVRDGTDSVQLTSYKFRR